jgi:hypothetical protein
MMADCGELKAGGPALCSAPGYRRQGKADAHCQITSAAGFPPCKLVLKQPHSLHVAVISSADELGGKLADLEASVRSPWLRHWFLLRCRNFFLKSSRSPSGSTIIAMLQPASRPRDHSRHRRPDIPTMRAFFNARVRRDFAADGDKIK